jgi:hypothetical protein
MNLDNVKLQEAFICILACLKQDIIEEVDRRFAKQKPIPTIQDDWIQKKEAKNLLGYSSDTSLQYLRDNNQIVFTYVSARKILYSRGSILEYLKSKKGIDYGQVG